MLLSSLPSTVLNALRAFWLCLVLIFDRLRHNNNNNKCRLNDVAGATTATANGKLLLTTTTSTFRHASSLSPSPSSSSLSQTISFTPTTAAAAAVAVTTTTAAAPLAPCMRFWQWHQHKPTKFEQAAATSADRKLPRPRGLPLIGTFWDLLAAGGAQQLHKYIHRRHVELGPIFYERLGGVQDVIFVSSASQMRAVFQYEGQYPRHPLPEAWTIYNKEYKCKRGLFFMEGEEWYHNRRVLNRFLLGGTMRWMDGHIEACTMRLVNLWKTLASGQTQHIELMDLEHQLYYWAIDVVCAVMFGVSAAEDPHMSATMDEFSRIVHRIFETSATLANFPAKLAKKLNMRIWRDFETSVEAVLKQGNLLIDQFIEKPPSTPLSAPTKCANLDGMIGGVTDDIGGCHDYVDSDVLYHKLKLAGMPLEMIKRIFVDLVIAAGDTTAYTTEWAFYLLTQDPEMQQRMATEMTANDGHGNMLVHGLIRESMRLYPIAPFIGRYLATDANIGGYEVERNSLVLLSLYTAGREPKHFPDPEVAKPERWQRNEETGDLQGVLQAHGSLPFGISNRSCIGRRMAMKQMHSLLATVINTFDLQCNNTTPIDCKLRLVTVPDQPLRLAIKLRDIA